MTSSQAILIGFAMTAAAVWVSNAVAPVGAQPAPPIIIPPVEAWVPARDAPEGPWHLWRMNRHTGQLSFCTAEIADPPADQAAPQKPKAGAVVDCTPTSSPM